MFITVSVSFTQSGSDLTKFQDAPNNIVLSESVVSGAELATTLADRAAAELNKIKFSNSKRLPKMAALGRLQMLSWSSSDSFRKIIQPERAADYGLAAAIEASDQFAHIMTVRSPPIVSTGNVAQNNMLTLCLSANHATFVICYIWRYFIVCIALQFFVAKKNEICDIT